MATSDSAHPEALLSSGRNSDFAKVRVLAQRPEVCMVDARGMLLMLQLTTMRSEWLAELRSARQEAVKRYGGPRPFIALCKLDRRFPIDIGFDQELRDLQRELEGARADFSACAVIVSFDGLLGDLLRHALGLIGLVAGREPPMRVCSTAAEAVCWIEPYAASSIAGPFDRAYFLGALRALEALMGSTD